MSINKNKIQVKMNVTPEEERFSKNTIIMAHAVHESVQKLYNAGYKTVDPNMLALYISMISSFDKHELIQGFIKKSHEICWDRIKRREEAFFLENGTQLFEKLPMDKVELFKDLFLTKDSNGNNVVTQEFKDQLWELFDAMVKISIKYIHKNRSPYSYSTADGIVNAYRARFFDDVDIARHAIVWNIKFEFPPAC
jgi:hypothetical protein